MNTLEELIKKIQSLNEDKKYSDVIEALPDAILETHNSADLYAEKARAFYKLKKYEFSNAAADKALSINPKHVKANNRKGAISWKNQEYTKAIAFYNKAIESDPSDAYAFNGLGNAYYALKDYDKAIAFYNKAIESDPGYASPFNGLGNAYSELKEYDKAIAFYNKAIESDPGYAFSLNGLGNVYYDLKDYDKAIVFYNKAIESDPGYVYPYYNLGLTYYNLEDYDKAIVFFNKAIETDPNFTGAYFNLGPTYYELKKYDKSLVHYEKYVTLTKDKPDYYTSLAESAITELKKLIENTAYSSIRELVNKIKELLLFEKGSITHYTSLSVAKALIIDESSFRLSEGAFLNDTSEGKELYKFLSFNFFSQKGDDTIAELFTQKPFLGSFVPGDKHDDLTLWRMYGKEEKEEAKGCAITIELTKLLENLNDKMILNPKDSTSSKTDEEFRFYRIAYRIQGKQDRFIIPGESKQQEKTLNEYMDDLSARVKAFNPDKRKKASDRQNLVELLNEIAYLFKSAEYQHEKELRLVIRGIGFTKEVDPGSHQPRVYIELVTARPLIDRITLGPKVERADEWAAAFFYSLSKEGYQPEIHISHLPFK